MAKWINLLQNNRPVFYTAVTFIVIKTGPMHLVLVGLMAGKLSDKNLIVLNGSF